MSSVKRVSKHSALTFERLHYLYLGIIKWMKTSTVNYLRSDRLKAGGVQKRENWSIKSWARILCSNNVLLTAWSWRSGRSFIYLLTTGSARWMRRNFWMAGWCELLQRKDHRWLETLFLFVAALIYWSMEHEEIAQVTNLHIHYSETIADVTWDMRQGPCNQK